MQQVLTEIEKDCWEKQWNADAPYFLQDLSHEPHTSPTTKPFPHRGFIRQLIVRRYISLTCASLGTALYFPRSLAEH